MNILQKLECVCACVQHKHTHAQTPDCSPDLPKDLEFPPLFSCCMTARRRRRHSFKADSNANDASRNLHRDEQQPRQHIANTVGSKPRDLIATHCPSLGFPPAVTQTPLSVTFPCVCVCQGEFTVSLGTMTLLMRPITLLFPSLTMDQSVCVRPTEGRMKSRGGEILPTPPSCLPAFLPPTSWPQHSRPLYNHPSVFYGPRSCIVRQDRRVFERLSGQLRLCPRRCVANQISICVGAAPYLRHGRRAQSPIYIQSQQCMSSERKIIQRPGQASPIVCG